MKLICDICSDVNPVWQYRVIEGQLSALFKDSETQFVDSGEWLACAACAEAIDARSQEKLALRGLYSPTIRRALRQHEITRIEAELKMTFLAEFLIDHLGEKKAYVE